MAAYKPNALDNEFSEFWSNVNCMAVVTFPYEIRCDFVKRANSCIHGTNVVPYMQLMSCEFKCRNQFEELLFVSFFLVVCVELVLCLGYVSHHFYSPALKVVSRMLHMNEHLAGMTIMAFGNSLPDLFANLTTIYTNEPLFANNMSMGIFVTMFVGGLSCYISPFKLSGYTTVHDLLFLILGLLSLDYFISNDNVFDLVESVTLIVIYLVHMAASVTDLYLQNVAVKSIKREINELDNLPYTDENQVKQDNLQRKYEGLREDDRVVIFQRQTIYSSEERFSFKTPIPSARRTVIIEYHINPEEERPTKNHHLFKDFFHSLKPINLEDWKNASIIHRAFYVARVPVVLIAALYIPLVDYEMKKNGWSKLLNCIQIVINPIITITLVKSLILKGRSILWYYNIPKDLKYGLYCLVLTVPMSIFVFFNTNTSEPPRYHALFMIMNLTGSMLLNFQCSCEFVLILNVVGSILQIPSDFLGATVQAVGTSLNDLVNNIVMTLDGYEKMAFAAAIGGPFFMIVFGTGVVLTAKLLVNGDTSVEVVNGMYGRNAYVMLLLGLLSTLLWSSVLNFHARRSVGIFSMSICALHFLILFLIRKGIIHQYEPDIDYSAIYVPF